MSYDLVKGKTPEKRSKPVQTGVSVFAETAAVMKPARAFNIQTLDVAYLVTLLQECANASALISFGFNRSGGLNLTAIVEGERKTLPCYSAQDVIDAAEYFIDTFTDYSVKQGWRLPTG